MHNPNNNSNPLVNNSSNISSGSGSEDISSTFTNLENRVELAQKSLDKSPKTTTSPHELRLDPENLILLPLNPKKETTETINVLSKKQRDHFSSPLPPTLSAYAKSCYQLGVSDAPLSSYSHHQSAREREFGGPNQLEGNLNLASFERMDKTVLNNSSSQRPHKTSAENSSARDSSDPFACSLDPLSDTATFGDGPPRNATLPPVATTTPSIEAARILHKLVSEDSTSNYTGANSNLSLKSNNTAASPAAFANATTTGISRISNLFGMSNALGLDHPLEYLGSVPSTGTWSQSSYSRNNTSDAFYNTKSNSYFPFSEDHGENLELTGGLGEANSGIDLTHEGGASIRPNAHAMVADPMMIEFADELASSVVAEKTSNSPRPLGKSVALDSTKTNHDLAVARDNRHPSVSFLVSDAPTDLLSTSSAGSASMGSGKRTLVRRKVPSTMNSNLGTSTLGNNNSNTFLGYTSAESSAMRRLGQSSELATSFSTRQGRGPSVAASSVSALAAGRFGAPQAIKRRQLSQDTSATNAPTDERDLNSRDTSIDAFYSPFTTPFPTIVSSAEVPPEGDFLECAPLELIGSPSQSVQASIIQMGSVKSDDRNVIVESHMDPTGASLPARILPRKRNSGSASAVHLPNSPATNMGDFEGSTLKEEETKK